MPTPMNRQRLLHILAGLLLLGAVAHPVSAQAGFAFAGVDLGVGLAVGQGGGPWANREGPGLSVVVAGKGRRIGRGALIVGANAHASSPLTPLADCVRRLDGGCVPDYPSMTAGGLFAGWEAQRGASGSALRLTIGPVFMRGEDLGSSLGAQGRVDAATPSLGRASLIGFAHVITAQLRDTRYQVPMFGAGVRIR